MKIIDFRFRPNIPSTVQGMIDHPVFGEMHALFKFHERARSQPIEDIVRDMEAQNVVKGVITSRDAETTYGIASGNKGVIPFLEQYPDRFIGMAGLDPHKGMDAIDELGLMVETHGFRGAAIDPFLAKIPANHAKYYPIYAKCCEFDIPVVISTPTFISSEGWDWIPGIRDRNIGIWQDVTLEFTGDVTLADPQVITDLPLPDTSYADLTIRAEVTNHADEPCRAVLRGTLDGGIGFSLPVDLAAGETRTVNCTPARGRGETGRIPAHGRAELRPLYGGRAAAPAVVAQRLRAAGTLYVAVGGRAGRSPFRCGAGSFRHPGTYL